MLNVGKRSFLFSKKSSAVETFYIGGSFQGTHGGEHLSFWDGSKWNPLGEPNNTVLNTQFDSNGNLYITGTFTAVGGVAANYIAKWDGSSWSSLGTGLGAAGFFIAIDSNDNVYVGGSFTTAGGNTANRVAKWNGSAWSALGDGTNNLVYSLAIDSSDNLYAGGFFTTAGGVSANRIAKWNTSSWSGLGSGMNGYVYSIIIDSSDNLYATGSFTTSGGVTTNAIAKWDVTSETWSGFSSGVGNSTNSGQSLMFLNGELVVGGFFTLPTPARLVKWNGTSWEASFGFPNNATYGLTPISSTSNSFYANGAFSNLGNTDGDRVAYWNGSSWENMGRGHSSSIPSRRGVVKDGIFYLGGPAVFNNKNHERSLSVSDGVLSEVASFNSYIYAFVKDSSGNLYVGGAFTTANDVSVNYVAKWDGSSWEKFVDVDSTVITIFITNS
jgi:hypothetical protein